MRMLSAGAAVSQKARLIVSRKRIFDPFELLAIDQHAVETAVAIPLADQVMLGGEDDPAALAGRDARSGATEIAAAALADFDENQHLAIAANEVDLAAADSEIPRYFR